MLNAAVLPFASDDTNFYWMNQINTAESEQTDRDSTNVISSL